MLELIKYMKESRRDERPFMSDILCLNCATILPNSKEDVVCTNCGIEIKLDRYLQVYEYSSSALRYGYQYNKFYSEQSEPGSTKPCLAELPEIYKFVALAIASGIIGGASWDATKQAIQKVLAQFQRRTKGIQERIEPILDFDQIESIAFDIQGYTEGLSHLNKTVVPLVLEEIYADSATKYIEELEEIYKLFEKPNKKDKNRKRAIKLYKRLMKRILDKKLSKPEQLPVSDVWAKIEDNNQVNKDASR